MNNNIYYIILGMLVLFLIFAGFGIYTVSNEESIALKKSEWECTKKEKYERHI